MTCCPTGPAACGACCDPVKLAYPLDHLTGWGDALSDPRTDDGWVAWQTAGWQLDRAAAISKHAGGVSESGRFAGEHWTQAEHLPDRGDGFPEWRIRCDQWNPHTRLCEAGEGRPPICSGYPWYGREPYAEASGMLDRTCVFHADLGRTVLPLIAVTEGGTVPACGRQQGAPRRGTA